MDVTNGRYFEPRIVRELCLAQHLEGIVEVQVNGTAHKGILLYYESRDLDEEYEYKLAIHLQKTTDDLYVIYHNISLRS
jgi:hypothetical protein